MYAASSKLLMVKNPWGFSSEIILDFMAVLNVSRHTCHSPEGLCQTPPSWLGRCMWPRSMWKGVNWFPVGALVWPLIMQPDGAIRLVLHDRRGKFIRRPFAVLRAC